MGFKDGIDKHLFTISEVNRRNTKKGLLKLMRDLGGANCIPPSLQFIKEFSSETYSGVTMKLNMYVKFAAESRAVRLTIDSINVCKRSPKPTIIVLFTPSSISEEDFTMIHNKNICALCNEYFNNRPVAMVYDYVIDKLVIGLMIDGRPRKFIDDLSIFGIKDNGITDGVDDLFDGTEWLSGIQEFYTGKEPDFDYLDDLRAMASASMLQYEDYLYIATSFEF